MSGLRFCFLTTFYPPYNFGGDGIAVQRLARALVGAGHHVTVIHDAEAFRSLGGAPALPAGDPDPPGLRVVTLESTLGPLSSVLTQQLGRPVVHGRRIAALLNEGDFDVIHYHNISLVGGPGVLALGSALKVYTAHEHWLVCPTHVLWRHRREPCVGRECLRCQLRHHRPPQVWRYTGLLERQLEHVDLFLAMSAFSREKHREFGFPREMEVLPGFVDDAEAGSQSAAAPQSRPYFLFVGRLEPSKGIADLLPLFEGDGPFDLLIAGDGTLGDELRAGAGASPRIRFLGRVTPEALAPLYGHARALVVPTRGFETFGLVVIEAFRHGVPVIARRIGPYPELIEGSGGGTLFSTTEELAAAIGDYGSDAAGAARRGAAGREAYLQHWTSAAVTPKYLDLIRGVAARQGRERILATLGRN